MSTPSSNEQFTDLLLRHQAQVFGYIFAAVQNLHDAEELYQDTSLVLWSKFADYRPGSDFARSGVQNGQAQNPAFPTASTPKPHLL